MTARARADRCQRRIYVFSFDPFGQKYFKMEPDAPKLFIDEIENFTVICDITSSVYSDKTQGDGLGKNSSSYPVKEMLMKKKNILCDHIKMIIALYLEIMRYTWNEYK